MQNSLFSTYRQGENRITSSFLALLERVSVGTFNKNFQILLEESSKSIIQLVSQSKKNKGKSVPDAEISFRFKIIIETTTGKDFNNQVYHTLEYFKKSAKENQQLSEFCDWLLPMIMNGQVTIKDAEEMLNESELRIAAEKKEGYGE